jgi:hypothetical protein
MAVPNSTAEMSSASGVMRWPSSTASAEVVSKAAPNSVSRETCLLGRAPTWQRAQGAPSSARPTPATARPMMDLQMKGERHVSS